MSPTRATVAVPGGTSSTFATSTKRAIVSSSFHS
jgi:hypothetical protein